MKVVAFNGSARKGGNTAQLVQMVFGELEKEGIATELVELSGSNLSGCIACYKCFKEKDMRCAVQEDALNSHIEKMRAADGIILASPTYFSDVSANMKALIERAGMVSRANGDLYARKVGAPVVAVRRAGGCHVLSSLNFFFFIGQMIVPGSSYWNIGYGLDKGQVQEDAEGKRTMETLGRNMAWLLKKLHG